MKKDLRNTGLLPKEQGVYVALKGLAWRFTCPGTQHKSSGLKSAYTVRECKGESSTHVKASPGAGARWTLGTKVLVEATFLLCL